MVCLNTSRYSFFPWSSYIRGAIISLLDNVSVQCDLLLLIDQLPIPSLPSGSVLLFTPAHGPCLPITSTAIYNVSYERNKSDN